MIVTITRRVYLEPRFLDKNIKDHLLTKILKQTDNECSQEYGYILSVKKILEVMVARISPSNSDIICKVQFEAEILKPIEGKNLTGEVCMIFTNGIFLDIKGKLKVLIPTTSLNGYILNREKMYYVRGESKIQKGDILTVKITGTQYSKKIFNCFGSLVEDEILTAP